MKLKKIICALCCALVALCAFGCGPSGGNLDASNTNPQKTFRIISTWEKSGIKSHYNAGSNVGPLQYFTVEGLYQYVRSTDEIFPMLAASLPAHSEDGLTTTIKIRDNAKWHNGEKFTPKDVWAYYYLNHTTVTNYLLSVEADMDNNLVVLKWNPRRVPVNQVKDLLIAQDLQGIVNYTEFMTFADAAYDVVQRSADIPEDSTRWGAFNKFSTGTLLQELNRAISGYKAKEVSWFVATGAFKLAQETPTQLLLRKNKDHWNASKIGFETIQVYSSSDSNQTYRMLAADEIDYLDGLAPRGTLESILNSNKTMAHLKMYDPGSIGVLFNMEKTNIWSDKVREAFQYLFDRDEVRKAGNIYGVTSWYPLLGMAESEAETWMSEEGFNDLPKFSYNQAKAEELLKEAGWTKTDGKWYNKGALVDLTIGSDTNHPGMKATATAIQAALDNFGIKSSLKLSEHGAWYSSASMTNSTLDMSVYWTDLNMSFSYPTGSYKYFDSMMARVIHVNRYPDNYEQPDLAGAINEEFDDRGSDYGNGSGKVNFSTYVNIMYVYGPEDIKEIIDIYNNGIAEKLWGIQMYQNVTGSFLNVNRILNTPMETEWREDRNITKVPEAGTDDFFAVARTNLIYSNGIAIVHGFYQPNAK